MGFPTADLLTILARIIPSALAALPKKLQFF